MLFSGRAVIGWLHLEGRSGQELPRQRDYKFCHNYTLHARLPEYEHGLLVKCCLFTFVTLQEPHDSSC